MKDLNVRKETIKILEYNIGSNLFYIGHSNFLLDMSPETRETKAKINYLEYIKIKGNNQKNKKQKNPSNLIKK